MDLTTVVFYVFALITVGSAAVVVFSKNIVYSAFALLFAFFGVAGLYALMMADFLAVTQLLIYVGGILVLVLFGVMLTSNVLDVQIRSGTMHIIPALFIVGALAAILLLTFWSTDWTTVSGFVPMEQTGPEIGELFLTRYLLPFEIASVILLVALIGAAMIARRERKA
ncbi:MAG TPA: NADH-quinone oxidoreductase subunit J [Bacteroidota bacterium]|nr:NADH-quinone oxidoreductase subunit J [Bacteroidota bacterium]